jgi:AAA15 family ATPase/GTPase
MTTEKEINADILKITMTIKANYPELSKYLNEMQVTIPDVARPQMTNKILFEYYKSLESMITEYIPNHS